MKKAARKTHQPKLSKDVPATRGMLFEVRDELKHEMSSGFFEIKTKFEKVLSEIHRIGLLVEDQSIAVLMPAAFLKLI